MEIAPIRCGLEDLPCLRAPREKHHLRGCQTFPLRGSAVPASFTCSGVHDTYFLIIMMRDIDIRKKCTPLSCFQVARPFFQGVVERMTTELTALAPSTMRSRWLPNISVTWKYCSRQVSLAKKAADPRHDADIRIELSANVVLSGGTAIFQGIIERMTKELTALALFTMKIKVVAPTWHGLEDLSCFPSVFEQMRTSKGEGHFRTTFSVLEIDFVSKLHCFFFFV